VIPLVNAEEGRLALPFFFYQSSALLRGLARIGGEAGHFLFRQFKE